MRLRGAVLDRLPGIMVRLRVYHGGVDVLESNTSFRRSFNEKQFCLVVVEALAGVSGKLELQDRISCEFQINCGGKADCWYRMDLCRQEPSADGYVYLGKIMDITQRKLAQDQLRAYRGQWMELANRQINPIHPAAVDCWWEAAAQLQVLEAHTGSRVICCDIQEKGWQPELGTVLEKSRTAWEGLLAGIYRGEAEGNAMVLRADAYGNGVWYRDSYELIAGADDSPDYAVICSRNMKEEYERDIRYERYRCWLEQLPRGACCLILSNLSKNMVLDVKGELGGNIKIDNLSEIYYRTAVSHIREKDQKQWLEFNRTERLITCWKQGKNRHEMEFCVKTGKEKRWIREIVTLFSTTYGADVYARIMFWKIDREKKKQLQLEAQVSSDMLAGFLNKRSFEEKFTGILRESAAKAKGCEHALLLLRLSGYRELTAKLGDYRAEQQLIEAAHKIRELIRGSDLLGRLDSDNILIGLIDVSEEAIVRARAEQLCQKLYRNYAKGIVLGATIGIAFAVRDGAEWEVLYQKAENALKAGIDAGGNRYCFYGELQEPMQTEYPGIDIRTFGGFEVYIEGEPLEFASRKGKELLALLVDRRGGLVTTEEAIATLWSNDPMNESTAGRYRQTVRRLKKELEQAGIGDILISRKGGKGIRTELVQCDLFRYMDRKDDAELLYQGRYLEEYPWAEQTRERLQARRVRFREEE